jgi:asparagine synthase (glutamine-hydrolysing)
MCGIAGVVALKSDAGRRSEPLPVIVERMSERMHHRGPDGAGVWSSHSGSVALAHRRLSIVDLSEGGRQPMSYASGRYWITFNGEIYNFRELATQLQSLGHSFQSSSDTEVLLAAVTEWGITEALKRLVGMFAFGLWDEYERVLHLARDRLGEKPLYLGEIDGYLYFASELRAFRAIPGFRAQVSGAATASYLRDGCVPSVLSIYDGVYKLAPGHLISVPADRDQHVSQSGVKADPEGARGSCELQARAYWSCAEVAVQGQAQIITDETAAAEQLESLLRDSIRMQMHADVATGAFLSGGVDSSLVVALMQVQSGTPVHTFTVAFDDPRFDESQFAAAVASHLGTHHEQFVLREADIVRQVPSLIHAMDEPTANGSFFPVYLISQLARCHVKVVLSGDGGDELFAGYNRYLLARRAWRVCRWVPTAMRRGIANLMCRGRVDDINMLAGLMGHVAGLGSQANVAATLRKLVRVLRSHSFAESYQRLTYCWDEASLLKMKFVLPPRNWQGDLYGELAPMLLADQLDYLPDDSLAKVDRASMAVSLETRLPLLDHRVVEFSWRLADRLKVADGVAKRLLRKVLYRYMPRRLIERKKMGFSVPVDAWLKGPLREWATDSLHSRHFREDFPFLPGVVQHAWDNYLKGNGRSGYELWALVMLAGWAETSV